MTNIRRHDEQRARDHNKFIICKNNNLGDAINTLLIFCLLFFSNDTYLFGTNKISVFVSIPRYIMLAFCMLGLLYCIFFLPLNEHKRKIIWYCTMLIIFVVICIVNKEYFNRTVNKMLFITGGLIVSIILKFHDYSVAFRKAMMIISISSNVLWLLAYIVPEFVLLLPQIENTAGVRYATIILSGLDLRTIYSMAIRSGGIFWEPGVYQMFLNLAILFELFIEERPRKVYLITYCIALLSTFSTTGYIAFLWLILIYILFGGRKPRLSKGSRWLIVLPLVAIALLVFISKTSIGRQVFEKASNLQEGTTMVRLASFFASISIALSHPIFGVGMEHVGEQMFKITRASDFYFGWTSQNTNTMLYQFVAHGCIFGSLFLIGTSLFGRLFRKGIVFSFFVFVLISILYIGENLMVSILPYILIFYGLEGTEDKKIQRGEEIFINDNRKSRYIIY